MSRVPLLDLNGFQQGSPYRMSSASKENYGFTRSEAMSSSNTTPMKFEDTTEVAAIPKPPTAPGSQLDGKQFFRECKSRLSYEAFTEFLTLVK
jgi:hypothetical protein